MRKFYHHEEKILSSRRESFLNAMRKFSQREENPSKPREIKKYGTAQKR